jgi:hypothetical protein
VFYQNSQSGVFFFFFFFFAPNQAKELSWPQVCHILEFPLKSYSRPRPSGECLGHSSHHTAIVVERDPEMSPPLRGEQGLCP